MGSIGLMIAAWLLWVVLSLPDVSVLRAEPPGVTAFMQLYLEEQAQEAEKSSLHWTWVPDEAISPHLKRAVLVSEDINFFSHDGFDRAEIGSALREAWAEKSAPRGASTLTQQLARNLYLSPVRTPWRKLQEALLTRRLEAALGKQRILEIYLNVVEFGPGIYGAEAASRHYFGVAAAQLSEAQAAELAVGLPRPKSWHPGRESAGYRAAVERILRRMEKAEFLWRLI
jgi:monofunctional biosynthetic peptidoglycan transglycosylase